MARAGRAGSAMEAAAAEVRYGIVGVGMMGREHLHNLAHLAGQVEQEQSVRIRVTCLADPHQESLLLGLRLAAELGLPTPQKRRQRINERLRILQQLIPNGTKVGINTMLEEAVHYVKFMYLQIKLLSSDELWMYAPLAYDGVNVRLPYLDFLAQE